MRPQCCMLYVLKSEVSIREVGGGGGREGGGLGPLFLSFLDPPLTASNPLRFGQVKLTKKVKSGYVCSGKNCSGDAAEVKGFSVQSCCLHLHLLLASLRQSLYLVFSNSVPSSTSSCKSSYSS